MRHAHQFFRVSRSKPANLFSNAGHPKIRRTKRAKQKEEEEADKIVKFVCIDIDSVWLSCFFTIHTIHIVMYTYDLLGHKHNNQPKQPSVDEEKKSLKDRFFFPAALLIVCSICVYEYEVFVFCVC